MDQRTYDTAQQGLLVCLLDSDHQERLQAFLSGLRHDEAFSEEQIVCIERSIREVLERGQDDGNGGADNSAAETGKPLSEREQAVLKLVAKGFNGKEIAVRFELSAKTIETYKARALVKLDLKGRPEVIRYALEHGWFDDQGDRSQA